MTKLDDAERKIIREWDAWAPKQSDPSSLRDGFPFYRHLLKEKSELLKFRYTGDKWQRVYGCLLRAGRVKDSSRWARDAEGLRKFIECRLIHRELMISPG